MSATMSPQALGSVSVSVSTPVAVRETGSVSGAPLALLRLEGAAALEASATPTWAAAGRARRVDRRTPSPNCTQQIRAAHARQGVSP